MQLVTKEAEYLQAFLSSDQGCECLRGCLIGAPLTILAPPFVIGSEKHAFDLDTACFLQAVEDECTFLWIVSERPESYVLKIIAGAEDLVGEVDENVTGDLVGLVHVLD